MQKNYIIFGNGRVGRHMEHYWQHLGHRVAIITKKQALAKDADCLAQFRQADIIAAAIPDNALAQFAQEWPAQPHQIAIHFSGAQLVEGMLSYHPLYSFPDPAIARAPLDDLRSLAFACQEGAPPLGEIMPGATNPSFTVPSSQRAHYHALAVLSGNFPAFLWNETAKSIGQHYESLDPQMLKPYLESIIARYCENPTDSLTGPIARNDTSTIAANLNALNNEPVLSALYRSFLAAAGTDIPAPATTNHAAPPTTAK